MDWIGEHVRRLMEQREAALAGLAFGLVAEGLASGGCTALANFVMPPVWMNDRLVTHDHVLRCALPDKHDEMHLVMWEGRQHRWATPRPDDEVIF